MSVRPRVALLTSRERRHRFAARGLAASPSEVDLVGIVAEAKTAAARPAAAKPTSPDERLVADHFAGRDAAEARILGEVDWPEDVPRHEIASGGVNAPETVSWLAARRPDLLVLYGTGIVRPPLLDLYRDRIVNLHLGLSPYFRGAGTNFWPLVERCPECVGATLHLAVAAVDAGPVLAQLRPPVDADDGAHEMGTRTLAVAVERLPAVVATFAAGRLAPRTQPTGAGHLYRLRDFDAGAVRRLRYQLATGMIAEYLADKAARDAAYPIVAPELAA